MFLFLTKIQSPNETFSACRVVFGRQSSADYEQLVERRPVVDPLKIGAYTEDRDVVRICSRSILPFEAADHVRAAISLS